MMKVALLTTMVFHDAQEITRIIDGKPVRGQDKVIWGGAEKVLRDLCYLLKECGCDVTIFQPFHGISQPFTKMFKGIPVVCLPVNGGWEYQTNVDLNWQFNEHASLFDMRIYFSPFLAFANAVSPCIVVSHGIYWDNIQGANITRTLDDEQEKEFFKRQFYGFMAADVVVSVDSNTKKVVQAMKPGYEKRIQIIYNYADTQEFYPIKKKTWNGINVLYPRRLTTLRGSTEVTKAFIRLPQYNFTLAGQAWDGNAAKAFFDSHKHRGNVNFLHKEMDGMPDVYRNADISLVPTISTEGLSLSLLESMACGLATITTPVGGLGDACIDGYNCLIYDPNHEELTDYIMALAEDEETRIKFGKRNREIAVECFDISIWRQKWRNLLARFGAVPEKQYFNKPVEDLTDKDIDKIARRVAKEKKAEIKETRQKAIQKIEDAKPKKTKLVAMMLTHNETGRYLERVIENTLLFCDEIFILDDHSTDGTQELLKSLPSDNIIWDESKNTWENESLLRQELLDTTLNLQLGADWLIAIDADELYEADEMNKQLPYLMSEDKADWIGFRFYDMWDEEHYRDDDIWPGGNGSGPRMFRVNQNESYTFPDKKRHCGSVPEQVLKHSGMRCSVRVKHLGWAKNDDRDRKYLERTVEDPDSTIFPREIYDAILDPSPTLVKWDDNNPWQTSKLTIAYPPCMHWNIMQQRPHHLLRLAAGERNRVFFGDDSATGTYEPIPYLTVVRDWESIQEVDVLYTTSPEQMARCENIKYKKLIYDCCDWMENQDIWLIEKADAVLCASRLLFERISGIKIKTIKYGVERNIKITDLKKVIYLPNACDFDHFSKTGDPSPEIPEPVVGYMGCIHPVMVDEAIVNALADKFKLLMIGQNKGMEFNNPNIYIAGHVQHKKLPGLLAQCKVGIIPFRTDSDYLRYSAPIKVWEYMASGRPVVASPIPELEPLADLGLIRIVANDDLKGWIKAVEYALSEYPNTKGIEYAREQTWNARYGVLKQEVLNHV